MSAELSASTIFASTIFVGAGPTPSDVLIAQITTAVPTRVLAPIAIVVWLLIAYWIGVIRDRRPCSTAAQGFMVFICIYAVLRIGDVHRLLIAHTPLRLTDIRLIAACFLVAAAFAILLLAIRWRSRNGQSSPRVELAVYLAAAITMTILVIAQWPAHQSGLAIEELHSWRTGTYLTAQSLPFVIAEALSAFTLIQMAFTRSATTARRLLVGIGALAVTASTSSMVIMMTSGWMMSVGAESVLTIPRSAVRNDWGFYPAVLPCIAVGLFFTASDLARRLGIDNRGSRRIRTLVPLWRDLTAAAPHYRLPAGGSLATQEEREHRMRIEIEDIVVALSSRLPAGTHWPEQPAGRADLLRSAIDEDEPARARPGCGPPPKWVIDDRAVDAVAAAWSVSNPGAWSRPDRGTVVPSANLATVDG